MIQLNCYTGKGEFCAFSDTLERHIDIQINNEEDSKVLKTVVGDTLEEALKNALDYLKELKMNIDRLIKIHESKTLEKN